MLLSLHRRCVLTVALVAGFATAATAQTNNSTLRFEVREVGTTDWLTDVEVTPGATVEFRGVLTYIGSAPAVGLQRANFQPTVSNWNAADVLRPFRTWGTSTVPTPPGQPTSGVDADSGEYGRINPYAFAGISFANALRGHTNLVEGTKYLRVAQASATDWVGFGPTTGTGAANNFNGVSGLALGQRPPTIGGQVDPDFVAQTTDVEVVRLAIQINATGVRTLVVDAPIEGFSAASVDSDLRGVAWYTSMQSSGAPGSLTWGGVTVSSATIRVPTPGALAILGFGGLMAGCRRRGQP